jgi:hypothetical protein
MGRIQRGRILIAVVFSLAASVAVSARPIQVYGVWHCGSDLCGWDAVRDMTDFDRSNHWLIDRGDGKPSVNLAVLSFVDPLRLLNLANDAHNINGIPIGITPEIVSYFTSHKIRVMISIGGAYDTSTAAGEYLQVVFPLLAISERVPISPDELGTLRIWIRKFNDSSRMLQGILTRWIELPVKARFVMPCRRDSIDSPHKRQARLRSKTSSFLPIYIRYWDMHRSWLSRFHSRSISSF